MDSDRAKLEELITTSIRLQHKISAKLDGIEIKVNEIENQGIRLEVQMREQQNAVTYLEALTWRDRDSIRSQVQEAQQDIDALDSRVSKDITRLEDNLNIKWRVIWGLLTTVLGMMLSTYVFTKKAAGFQPPPIRPVKSVIHVFE